MNYLMLILILGSVFVAKVFGHGYMLVPLNRASRWRLTPTNWSVPHDYEDNQFFCGGFQVQYEINDGKCGPCGDDWRDAVPRDNENGGKFGNGVVVATYLSGSVIRISVRITANHRGKISYQLCRLNDPNQPESEDCFQSLRLADGSYYQNIASDDFDITSYVQLPNFFICNRCVLRWHYSAGNNWGSCGNGTSAIGCGNQETFRSCADIRILPRFWFWPFNALKRN